MTICIGTICDNKTKAIAIADRMVTDDFLSVEFEHAEKKIVQISQNCVVMMSGSSTSFQEILDPIIAEFKDEKPRISKIVESISQSYATVRRIKIDEKYFRPRGLSIENFYKDQSGLSERMISNLDRVVEEFNFPDLEMPAGLEILVVGVDDKAHIYHVDNPGTSTPFDELGWLCIGSGSPQAENSLISNRFNSNVSPNKGLYLTFEAKIKAEFSPGVGHDTDIVLIDPNGVRFLQKDAMDKLNVILKEKEKLIEPIENQVDNRVNGLDVW